MSETEAMLNDEKSEYEIMRDKKVARNEQRLTLLGLNKPALQKPKLRKKKNEKSCDDNSASLTLKHRTWSSMTNDENNRVDEVNGNATHDDESEC